MIIVRGCVSQFHQLLGCWLPDGVHFKLPKCPGFLLPGRATERVHRHLRQETHQQRPAAIFFYWIWWVSVRSDREARCWACWDVWDIILLQAEDVPFPPAYLSLLFVIHQTPSSRRPSSVTTAPAPCPPKSTWLTCRWRSSCDHPTSCPLRTCGPSTASQATCPPNTRA